MRTRLAHAEEQLDEQRQLKMEEQQKEAERKTRSVFNIFLLELKKAIFGLNFHFLTKVSIFYQNLNF